MRCGSPCEGRPGELRRVAHIETDTTCAEESLGPIDVRFFCFYSSAGAPQNDPSRHGPASLASRATLGRIRAALENLARDPFRRGLDVKMLKGEPNTRRLRVGPFRALFELDRVVRKVRVLRVPDRKDAY